MIFLTAPTDFKSAFDVSACFVECDGKILLLHRAAHKVEGNKWGMPAGKIEKGEEVTVAMARELLEETGLTASPSDFTPIKTVFVRYPERDMVFHMFLLRLEILPEVRLNSLEHQAFRWTTPAESLAMPLMMDEDICVKIAYENA